MTTNMIPGSPEANERLKNAVMTRDPKILKDVIERYRITSDEIINYRDKNGNTLIRELLSIFHKERILPTIKMILIHCKNNGKFMGFLNHESNVDTWLWDYLSSSDYPLPYIITDLKTNVRYLNTTSSTLSDLPTPLVRRYSPTQSSINHIPTDHDGYTNPNGVVEVTEESQSR